MTIRFRCNSCHHRVETSARSIGLNIPCPGCGQIVTIPKLKRVDPKPAIAEPALVVHQPEQQLAASSTQPTAPGSKALWGLAGAMVAVLMLMPIGFLLSQYAPVFGGILMMGDAWSPTRMALIPGHLLLFGLIGINLGALGG